MVGDVKFKSNPCNHNGIAPNERYGIAQWKETLRAAAVVLIIVHYITVNSITVHYSTVLFERTKHAVPEKRFMACFTYPMCKKYYLLPGNIMLYRT